MCRAFTHSSWLRPLSPAPSARLAAWTRRAAATVSCRDRATAAPGTVAFGRAPPRGGSGSGPPGGGSGGSGPAPTVPCPGSASVGGSSPGGWEAAEGISRVAGRGTWSGVVAVRSASCSGPGRSGGPALGGPPRGRREAGTAPWCRTDQTVRSGRLRSACGRCGSAGVRDNGRVTDSSAASLDLLAAAVEPARAAAVDTAGDPELVGEHLGVHAEPASPATDEVPPEALGEVLTHTFASRLPGYVGWYWAVTLAHVPGADEVTVDEVVLLPGDSALLAPAWVPWQERLRPGDLSVGDVLPSTEDDPRLVPAYAADDDSAEDPAGRVVAFELGVGRERVMSREGRLEAVDRWSAGDFGPASAMARHAPGPCATCGFFLPLAGSLRQSLGACGNAYSPADGRVVTADYGCGAHSQATLVVVDYSEVVTSARYDTADFDVL